MKNFLKFSLALTALLVSFNSFATHLIGGSLGYEYLGQVGTQHQYRITLTTYTNCDPGSSNFTEPEDPIAPIGVYEHDAQNDPTGGGSVKNQITTVLLNYQPGQSFQIIPDQPSGCSVGANTCIYKGVYEATVLLPANFTGYHLSYDRCCRNNSIVNLIQDESMSFYAYMPPPLIPNSSPVFTDDPVPFLCVGDTTTILNSAFDPDGDLLTFSFVVPYDGLATNGNPAPDPSGPNPGGVPNWPNLNWNIQDVTYAAGYSVAQPFGAGGYIDIGASTGLTTYYPPSVGDHVVAIEIREFRNGNLIGITRRDLQLLVLTCPANPAPIIDANLGTTNDVFRVEEGETLCFTYGYNDPNNNDVTITSTGVIFDANIISPPATITSPVSGSDQVSADFCWTTACGQARTAPYQFQISATDDGCPPQTANNVYEIFVDPVPPPVAVNGADVICQFGTETYTVTLEAGTYTPNWSVTGGNIVADNGNSIDIQWTNVGAASISVSATNQFGCTSESIDYATTITPAPAVEAGPDVLVCQGDSITLTGTTTANPGFTSAWSPLGNILDESTLTPTVFPQDTTMYYLTVDIGGGCSGIDSVQVNVSIPEVDAGIDTTICEGGTAELEGTVSGTNFIWDPAATLSDPNILNPEASPLVTTEYILELIDDNGCVKTDTVLVTVTPQITVTVSNDTTICDGGCASLNASGADTYLWSPVTGLDDETLSNPTACATTTTSYEVVGYTGACTDTNEVIVTVATTIPVDAGLDVQICEGDTIQLGASGVVDYVWTPLLNISDPNIEDPLVSPDATTTYTVTGTDATGCTSTDDVTVTVNTLPSVDAGNDTTICSNAPLVLQGSSDGIDFGWTPVANLDDPTILNPTATIIANTTFVLESEDANGCIATDTVEVTVESSFTLTTSNDTTICDGTCGSLSASGADTYEWTPIAGLDDPTIADPTPCPVNTTTYEVVGTIGACTDTAEIDVTVALPFPVNAGLDVDICEGETTQLNATGANDYTWSPTTNMSDPNIADPTVNPTATITYTVTGEDANGCTSTDDVIVTVNTLPTADAGEDKEICVSASNGGSVPSETLDGAGTGTPSWTPVGGLSDPNILDPIINPATTTDYTLTITDGNGCESTDLVTVTVWDEVPTEAGTPQTICPGDTVSIGGTPTSPGTATTYLWSPAAFIVDPNVANPEVFPDVTTMFYINTSNDTCNGLDSVLITVRTPPTVDAGVDVELCLNDTIQLNATGGLTYDWNTEITLSDSTISNPEVYPTVTTEYWVIGEDANGCTATDTVEVTVNSLPTIDAGNDIDICLGEDAQLNATGADTYVWDPATDLDDPNIENPLATPTSTTEYVVTGTDLKNCSSTDTVMVNINALPSIDAGANDSICIGETIQLNATGGTTYSWTPIADLSDPNIADPIASNTSTTMFFVTGIDANNCSGIDSVEIFVNALPLVDAGADLEICIGDSAQLNATGADSFTWSPSADLTNANIADPMSGTIVTTEYEVIGNSAAGCENRDTVLVTVNPLPVIDAGADQEICIGASANLSASGAQDYVWTPALSLDDATIATPIATPDSTTEYIVSGTDVNACVNSDTVIVSVFRINASADTAVCENQPVQLNVFGSNGNDYSWTPTTGLTDPLISNPVATVDATTTYYVSVTNIAGCTDQDSVEIEIIDGPLASFDMELVPGCDGIIAELTNTSIDATSFLWNFSDGDTSTLENPEHVFDYNSTFTVDLTVDNTFGCNGTVSETATALSYDDYFAISIPNVFTPNVDGTNDLYFIDVPGRIYECVDFEIYNRWGQIMFRATGNNIKWDGRTTVGQECPEGTYMYVLKINDQEYHGTIMLFR